VLDGKNGLIAYGGLQPMRSVSGDVSTVSGGRNDVVS
jgi:hypothetical protein